MQTTRKNVRNILITVVCIALALPASIAVLLLLPNSLSVGIIFFIAKFYTQIGAVALGIFIAFVMYKFYRFMQRTENPWQVVRANLRKNLILLFFILSIIYAFMVLFVFIFHGSYSRCDHYNKKLNGGIKEFQGQKFKINMCGTGGDKIQNNDEIRLQVFNEKGDLLALRHFVVDWDTNSSSRGIHYHPNHLAYVDESLQSDFNKTITMPPTALDWIRARIPLLD